jgi:hypothetical protein
MDNIKIPGRVHLFEFEDFTWFPDVIRAGGTDYLRYFLIRTELYQPCIDLIYETLKVTGGKKIIDLCSGGGGYIEYVHKGLNTLEKGNNFTITLTDKFPNIEAYQLIKKRTGNSIDYCDESVDVFHVPENLRGFRILFSAIHHFKPCQVRAILQNATGNNAPVAFFDGGERGIFAILGLILIHPVAFLIFTPFFKPFKLSRLFFTYIIPLIPLYTIWDGVVSILRMYRPEDLRQIAESLNADHYVWKSGKTKNRFGIKASYLIGYPKTNDC